MQLISYQSKNRARHGVRCPERCMTDVGYPFNLTLLQKYELTWK